MEFFRCISLEEGRRQIAAALADIRTAVELVALAQACGRVLAEDVFSRENLPAFARSTVDGFAVNSADTFGAGEGLPALLELDGEILMGSTAEGRVGNGAGMTIPTGGMLPEGADSVVMLEHTQRPDATTLLVLKPVAPGENIVRAGDDISAGGLILSKGSRITPQDIGALAACGIAELKVYCPPVVGVLSTGDEVIEPQLTPKDGQVRDANGPALAALIEAAGCRVIRYGIIRDEKAALRECLAEAAAACHAIVLSGGSSVGVRDHTVEVLEEMGQRPVVFHGLAVKPGKPAIFAMLGKTAVFGLPGHPVAALTVCRQLVLPALDSLSGKCRKDQIKVRAKMTRNMASAAGRDDFIKVRLRYEAGEYLAEPVLGKSGLIFTMTQADGEVHIPADKTGLYEAEWVTVELLRR
ncbi:molybdopterin-binding protein [Azotosporobacter soli]|uniref:molybdopterin molybdotransferase MoeA n=1 Tax=Azotosporobacter soli TaxID=3055040 RepID=UPI0031FE43F0